MVVAVGMVSAAAELVVGDRKDEMTSLLRFRHPRFKPFYFCYYHDYYESWYYSY